MRSFASDNNAPVAPEILAAIIAANEGDAVGYGDDPWTAFGVVVALGVTALIASAGAPAWWVMPLAVLTLLGLSVRRAAR